MDGYLELGIAFIAGMAAGAGVAYVLARHSRRQVVVYAPRGMELAPAGYEQVDLYASRGRSA